MPFRRLEILLFFSCWFVFAWFNQGGGWNQNARFAEVRAIVEEGRFAIDNFLLYRHDPERNDLQRVRVERAEYTLDGKRYRLCWVDAVWTFVPVGDRPLGTDVEKAPMVELCASGDIGYVEATGHFHPNKPPGTSFLAVPAYFAIFHVERALGLNPDHWFTLNLNCWLTTIFSVGLASALACVLFFRIAREFAGGAALPALLATLALAFGTTFFPFSTLLFDHNLTAALLLGGFYCVRQALPAASWRLFLGGFCAGLAAITNYIAAVIVIFLGLYVLLTRAASSTPPGWSWRRALIYSAGVVPPFLAICAYNAINFGSPFALNTDFQNPLFKDPSGSLGMFLLPQTGQDWAHLSYVATLLSISPYRGVFYLAPILVLGLFGWFVWFRKKTFVAEARLGIAIFAFFFIVNVTFNGYHGGFSAGPRYLVPGLPFLALPLVVGFARLRKTALLLLGLSLTQQFLLTVTDAQNSLAVGGHARIDDEHRKDDFHCNIVTEYAAPLFFTGRVGPLLEQMLEIRLEKEAARLESENPDPADRQRLLGQTRAAWRAAIDRGDPEPFLLAAIRGPVSVNPINVFDGLLGYGVWPLRTAQTDWASFNAGELLWPKTRLSLLPLVLFAGLASFAMVRAARREDAAIPQATMVADAAT